MILLLFLLASLVGATNTPLLKFTANFYSPTVLALLRFLIATIIIFPFVKSEILKTKFSKKLLVANIFFAANILIFVHAVKLTSVIMAGLIYLLSSLLIAVIGYFWLGEKLRKIQIGGLVISLTGMTILIFGSIKTNDILSFGTPLGNLLTLFSMCVWSLYVVTSRKLSTSYSPKILSFYNFAISTIIALILLPIDFLGSFKFSFNPQVVFAMLLLGTISTVAFFFLFQLVNSRTSAFTSSLINYLATVFSAVFGIIFFGEKLTVNLIFGAFLVVAGVFSATSAIYLKERRG